MIRSTALLRVLALAGLAASASGAPPGSVLPDAGSWMRVDTAHFTLYSDSSVSRTKEIALDLERFRAVLLLLKPSQTENAPVPTTLFVFKSDGAMDPYKPRYQGKPRNGAGFFQPGSDGNYIALTAAWNSDPRPLIYHEYFHYFMRSNFPPQPLWYEEGAAEFYSTFRSTGKDAEIGLPVERHIRTLRDVPLLPLRALFAVSHQSPEYNESQMQGVFYAESWALVHYFLRAEPSRAPEFGRFLVLLNQGKSPDDAFHEAFHAEPEAVLVDLRRYVQGSRYNYRRILFDEIRVASEVRVSPIPAAEALAELGDLLAHESEDMLPAAEAHLSEAIALNPKRADALAGMAFVRLRQKRDDDAADYFRRAVDAGSNDFRTSFRYGELRLRSLSGKSFSAGHIDADSQAALTEARAAFRRSIALNSGFPEAHAALGRSYLLESGAGAAEGIPDLEAAVRALPTRTDLALDLASLYARAGDVAKSEALMTKTLGPDAAKKLSSGPGLGKFEETVARINLLLDQHKDEEAIALLEALAAKAPSGFREDLESQLRFLKQNSARNRSRREYNEAVELWKKSDLPGALTLFRKVADTADDAELAKSAREQADRIAKSLLKPTPKRRG